MNVHVRALVVDSLLPIRQVVMIRKKSVKGIIKCLPDDSKARLSAKIILIFVILSRMIG